MVVTFQTPAGVALGLVGLLPVGVALWRERAARHTRSALELDPPPLRVVLARPVLLGLAFALLGLAAGHPLVRSEERQRERRDAELMFVMDNSRSMLASRGKQGTPRWRRAIAIADAIHAAVPEVPVGVAALNDRVVRYTFPTSQEQVLGLVLRDSYRINSPQPGSPTRWTTHLGAIDSFAKHGYFSTDSAKKVAVVITDAETRTYDPFVLETNLTEQGIELVYVRVWDEKERIYTAAGKQERYEPINPSVLGFAQTGAAKIFAEAKLDDAIEHIQERFGSGPTREVATSVRDVSIGAQLSVLALCALLLLVLPGARVPRPRRRAVVRPAPARQPAPARPPAARA